MDATSRQRRLDAFDVGALWKSGYVERARRSILVNV